MTESLPTANDADKRERILESAGRVVLAYGFQKVTMSDIAQAAEMSRPALYLLFKNKTEIYRAVAERHMRAAADAGHAALSREDRLEERLVGAVEPLIAMMEGFSASPHGAELLDMKSTLAGDLIEAWRTGMVRATAKVLAQHSPALETRGLSAHALAELFWDGVEGMKARVADPDAQRASVRTLARVVAGAI